MFIGRTDAEAEAPILWPPDAKNWLTGKDSVAGKDWRQEEKGMTDDAVTKTSNNMLNKNGKKRKKKKRMDKQQVPTV